MLNKTDVELLGGIKIDSETKKSLQIREMTGRDEEIIFDPVLLKNLEKLITELLFNIILDGDLTKNQIHEMYTGDRDILLLELRKVSYGNNMTITITCPSCQRESDFIIHLDQVKLKPFKSVSTPFELKKGFEIDKQIYTKGAIFQPTGASNEAFSIALPKNIGAANSELLAACIKFDDLEKVSADNIRDLSAKEKNQLLKLMGQNSFGPDMEQDVPCSSCGDNTRLSISLVDLFRPEL